MAEEGKWSNKVLINNILKLAVKIILPFSTVIFVKEFLFLVKSTQKPVHSCLNYIFFQKMPSQIIRLLKIPFLTTLHYFLAWIYLKSDSLSKLQQKLLRHLNYLYGLLFQNCCGMKMILMGLCLIENYFKVLILTFFS